MTTKLSPQLHAEVIRYHRMGYTGLELQIMFGISTSTVYTILKGARLT